MAKRNPEKTRQNILDTAIKEFAQVGYSGARVDRIAAESGSNKRMIYHYFSNKAGLYQEVFTSLYQEIRQHEMALKLDDENPVDSIVDLAGRTFDFFVQRPEFIRILNDKNLNFSSTAPEAAKKESLTVSLIERITNLLDIGKANGTIRNGLDATQLYISIAALGYFYLSNAHTLGALFQRDLFSQDEISQRREHITEAVRAIIRN